MMNRQAENELEAGQTPEAMAGAASKQIDKKNGDEKPVDSMDGTTAGDDISISQESNDEDSNHHEKMSDH